MPQRTTNRLFLPFGIWFVLMLALGLSAWLQISQVSGDRGMTNVFVFMIAVVSAVIVGCWFVFFSRFQRRARFGIAGLVIGLVATFLGLFRIDHFGGDMQPSFAWRFGTATEAPLEVPTTSTEVDLTTTTPWDFPQFLGPQRAAAVDVALARDWESRPPKRLWKQPIGAGWSGFAVVNGYAITQEQRGALESVSCYELETGALLWSHSIEQHYNTLIAGEGPRSTPTIDEGRVYALTSNGLLLALEGSSGELIWQHDLPAEYGVDAATETATVLYGRSNSPLIAGARVIVPAGGPPEGEKVSLVAFDKISGEKIWEGGRRQISYSSPSLAMLAGIEQVLSVNEASVSGHALESGKELWSFDRPARTNADPNASQPVAIPPDGVFVSKGYGLGGALLRLESDADGAVSVEQVWASPRSLRTKFTNVTVHAGHLYGLSDGILECVEVATGKRVWKRGRYYQGQILRARDLLIVLTEDGEVVLVEANPTTDGAELGRFQGIAGKTWNNFALYGPNLVIRNAQEAAVYRLPQVEQ